MRPGVLTCALTALFLTFSAPSARADTDAARQHFEAGKKLRDAGDCAGAIPEFDKSLAAEGSVGGYYNLGYCHERLSHRQEAYAAYRLARDLASSKKDDRLRDVSGALAALLETPHVRLVLPDPLPEGIRIEVDGEVVPETYYAAETVVFTKGAETHTVRVTAPGYEAREETVANKELKPIELRPPDKTLAPAPAAPAATEPAGWNWAQWTGAGATAAGLVVGGVLLYFFLDYYGEHEDVVDELSRHPCGEEGLCTADEQAKIRRDGGDPRAVTANGEALHERNNELEEDIRTKGLALGITGGVLIVGGLTMFILASGKPRASLGAGASSLRVTVAPQVGPHVQGMSLVGTF